MLRTDVRRKRWLVFQVKWLHKLTTTLLRYTDKLLTEAEAIHLDNRTRQDNPHE